ncbi:chorismate-binding protein [Marinitoga lauensis]|uniref:chorismate-binding protein n=1 Tax=Marinitoga lauensis TaxID=2201189 RepID=UPI001980EC44|nr:chorismate-binding protein [Marinitoga lauensis]
MPELFVLEEYATVYHLVSTVVGELQEEKDAIDLIMATFPGGSITGAPKIRAMEIIDELEPTQRNVYTGSIGYIGFDNSMDLNIVIRTVVCKNNKAYAQFGGGIVWDSNPELEYQESLVKGKALIEGLKME